MGESFQLYSDYWCCPTNVPLYVDDSQTQGTFLNIPRNLCVCVFFSCIVFFNFIHKNTEKSTEKDKASFQSSDTEVRQKFFLRLKQIVNQIHAILASVPFHQNQKPSQGTK